MLINAPTKCRRKVFFLHFFFIFALVYPISFYIAVELIHQIDDEKAVVTVDPALQRNGIDS
jgi:uncharacterized membrane protein